MAVRIAQTQTGTSTLATSTAVVWNNNTVSGNLIVVAVCDSSGTVSSVTSITDSQGNLYTQIFTNETNGNLADVELWYAKNILGGTTPTVTVNYNASLTSAVIIREYSGLDPVNPLYQKDGAANGNTSTPTSNTIKLTQSPALLVGAMGQIGLTGTISAGGNFVNLQTASNVNEVAIEDLLVTSTGSYSATFGDTASVQWECGIAAFAEAPHGTTTSTSSTSASTFSTSSTSSSISSTSSSISSTSTSVSTSSTSISTSSTSSSISSTSSSTSSTSISSTSSSTSISSTSSSVSSTSMSSTSISSTSSSTSISSTSSSFSSTSSSISSTSASTSSTSFSSTSSSSSTSTTAIPLNIDYSYQDSLVIPPAFVQSTTGTSSGATTPVVSTAFGSSITAGNLIVVTTADDSGANNGVTGVTDSAGNVYTQIFAFHGTSSIQMWYSILTVGGAAVTVNVSWNTGITAGVTFVAQEFSGISSNPLDVFKYSPATTSTAPLSPYTYNHSQAVELVVAGGIHTGAAAAWTLGARYSNLGSADVTNRSSAQESMVITSPLPQAGSFTIASSLEWICGVVTFKAKGGLPSTVADLTNKFTAVQYGDVNADDGDYFIEYGSEYLIREYEKTWINNTDSPTFTWRGRSTYDTRISPMLIQIFNVNSGVWETLAVANKIPPDTDFPITVNQTTNVSNYYDSQNVVTFRSYQQVI